MIRFLIIACLHFLVVSPAFAWNSLGHKTVAEIAWRQLDPATRQNIVDILRRHPRFAQDFVGKMDDRALTGDKALEDRWIFLHAATWPDQIRGENNIDKPTWHYVGLPMFLTPDDRKTLSLKLRLNTVPNYSESTSDMRKLNVLQAIAYSRDTIKSNKSPEIKSLAYCWLFHLVGDVHRHSSSRGLARRARPWNRPRTLLHTSPKTSRQLMRQYSSQGGTVGYRRLPTESPHAR
jgi:hypothetical protein